MKKTLLVEAFLEIMTYTSYLLEDLKTRQPAHSDVAQHYLLLLDRAEALRTEQHIHDEDWEQALFAVCAWVDEKILLSDWTEKNRWIQTQLQRLHFSTTRGGELFFERLKSLRPNQKQVREVYEYCLALGFRGRYFRPEDQSILDDLRRENLQHLVGQTRLDLPSALFPEAAADANPEARQYRLKLSALITALLLVAPVALFALIYFLFNAHLNHLIRIFQ